MSDWRYTQRTLMRALKVWRQGGWKEACRCLVLGAMIGVVPGLSWMVVLLGLCGLGALGVRRIASLHYRVHTPLAAVLHRLVMYWNCASRCSPVCLRWWSTWPM